MKPVSMHLPRKLETVFGKNQPEYIPLPAYKAVDGLVTTKWTLSLKERLQVLLGGSVYLQIMTFNNPLQPLKMMTVAPEVG